MSNLYQAMSNFEEAGTETAPSTTVDGENESHLLVEGTTHAPSTDTAADEPELPEGRFASDEEVALPESHAVGRDETIDASTEHIQAVLVQEQMTAETEALGSNVLVASDVHVVKKKWLPNKKASLIIGGVVLIAIAVGIALGLTLGDDSDGGDTVPSSMPSMAPTLAPTMAPSATPSDAPTDSVFSVVTMLVESIFEITLEDSTSPQYRAALWMADVDELIDFTTQVDSNRFAQRFVIVVFYYATGGDKTWSRQANFLSPTTHECNWNAPAPSNQPAFTGRDGVVLCEAGVATFIEMYGNDLSGTLPDEIGSLSGLQALALSVNDIQGTIPTSLFSIQNLLSLVLPFNDFSGTLPTEIGQTTDLFQLWIQQSSMTGTIPTEIGQTALRGLTLASSSFTGTLPTELYELSDMLFLSFFRNGLEGEFALPPGGMPGLETLDLSHNFFNGTLPQDLGTMPLDAFSATNNTFTGIIPESIQQSDSLAIFEASYNRLTGTIPSNWTQMSQSLSRLGMAANELTGPLPESLGSLPNLILLDVNDNSLNGTLPATLSNSAQLVFFQRNNFTGTVPESYGQLGQLRALTLTFNMLTGDISFFCNGDDMASPRLETLAADCFGEVVCPCCQVCCDDQNQCKSQ